MRIDRKINLGDITERAILYQELAAGNGFHNVSISPARRGASTPQHRYYRGIVVPLAKAWLNETQGGADDGEDYDEDGAHWFLKIALRPIPIVNKRTGEQIGVTAKSHAKYSLPEMCEYIDEVVKLLADNGVKVPPPSLE